MASELAREVLEAAVVVMHVLTVATSLVVRYRSYVGSFLVPGCLGSEECDPWPRAPGVLLTPLSQVEVAHCRQAKLLRASSFSQTRHEFGRSQSCWSRLAKTATSNLTYQWKKGCLRLLRHEGHEDACSVRGKPNR
jgi:hypothetical protein